MLTKFVQVLYSNKWFLVLQVLCYSVVALSFCMVYSCAKDNVYDQNGTTMLFIDIEKQTTVLEVESYIKRLTDENIDGYFYIDLGNLLYTPYNNVMLKEKKFSENAREIILQKNIDAGAKIGQSITLYGDSYKVIGYSDGYNLINYDVVSKESTAVRIILEHNKPFTDKERAFLSELLSESTLYYHIPRAINTVVKVVGNPIFIIGLLIFVPGMASLAILIFYSLSLREKLFDLLMTFEFPAKKALLLLSAEQVLTAIPTFFVGLILYFILRAFMFDVLAVLTFGEVILGLVVTATLSLLLTFAAFAGFWRRKNV